MNAMMGFASYFRKALVNAVRATVSNFGKRLFGEDQKRLLNAPDGLAKYSAAALSPKLSLNSDNMLSASKFIDDAATRETKVVVIRHGETPYNVQGIWCGWSNVGLTAKGQNDAVDAGRKLKESGFIPELVYCSPLARAVDTMKLMFPDKDFIKDARLAEQGVGDFTGIKKTPENKKIIAGPDTKAAPIDTKDNHEYHHAIDHPGADHIPFPTNESRNDVIRRTGEFYEDIIKPQIVGGVRTLALVMHSNSVKSMLQAVGYKEKISIGNTEPVEMIFNVRKNGEVTLKSVQKMFSPSSEISSTDSQKLKDVQAACGRMI